MIFISNTTQKYFWRQPDKDVKQATPTKEQNIEPKHIVILNDTSIVRIQHEIVRQMNGFSNSAPLFLPPGDKIDATRFEGWTFYLQQEGFKLLCDGSEVGLMKEEEEQGPLGAPEYIAAAVLESGREYRIVLDDACPALNMEEGAMGFSLVSSCLEPGGKVPRSRGTNIRVLPPPPAIALNYQIRIPEAL